MSLLTPINVLYRALHNVIAVRSANIRKQRSIRQLEQLDDYLLDDIGMKRIGDEVVSIAEAKHRQQKTIDTGVSDQAQRNRRVRHPYLLRRRQE